MLSRESTAARAQEPPSLPQILPQLSWHVLYTLPRHERRVSQQLAYIGLGSYVPLYETIRRWTDRRVKLELPLFPGYVFVQLSTTERIRVLQLPSTVRFVTFQARPAIIGNEEIESLRHALSVRKAEPHPYLAEGKRVRFRGGAFDGLEGVVVRRKQSARVIVSIDSIQRSLSIEADPCDLQAVA